jgi:hypothetical protein
VIRPALAIATTAATLLLLGACGDDGDSADDSATDSTEEAAAPTTAADAAAGSPTTAGGGGATGDDAPCGVTLEEVQALLPPDSGVTENTTPDPGRCNFTWDDGGPRGIDVAIVPGARGSFELPVDYEPLEGYGDEAYALVIPGRASAVAFVGEDLYAADVVATDDGGGGASEDELSALSLELLTLALD